METVYLLWVTEEDCDGETYSLDNIFEDQDDADSRGYYLVCKEDSTVVDYSIEPRDVVRRRTK